MPDSALHAARPGRLAPRVETYGEVAAPPLLRGPLRTSAKVRRANWREHGMKLLDWIRNLLGGEAHDEPPSEEQRAKREEADRAIRAMSRRR